MLSYYKLKQQSTMTLIEELKPLTQICINKEIFKKTHPLHLWYKSGWLDNVIDAHGIVVFRFTREDEQSRLRQELACCMFPTAATGTRNVRAVNVPIDVLRLYRPKSDAHGKIDARLPVACMIFFDNLEADATSSYNSKIYPGDSVDAIVEQFAPKTRAAMNRLVKITTMRMEHSAEPKLSPDKEMYAQLAGTQSLFGPFFPRFFDHDAHANDDEDEKSGSTESDTDSEESGSAVRPASSGRKRAQRNWRGKIPPPPSSPAPETEAEKAERDVWRNIALDNALSREWFIKAQTEAKLAQRVRGREAVEFSARVASLSLFVINIGLFSSSKGGGPLQETDFYRLFSREECRYPDVNPKLYQKVTGIIETLAKISRLTLFDEKPNVCHEGIVNLLSSLRSFGPIVNRHQL